MSMNEVVTLISRAIANIAVIRPCSVTFVLEENKTKQTIRVIDFLRGGQYLPSFELVLKE